MARKKQKGSEHREINSPSDLPEKIQNQINRKNILTKLYYSNPYMLQRIKDFRLKYSIPEKGFSNIKSLNEIYAWREKILVDFPERSEHVPKQFKQNPKTVEILPNPDAGETFGAIVLSEETCIVDAKIFQEELRAIFKAFGGEHKLTDYFSFEWFVISNRIPTVFYSEQDKLRLLSQTNINEEKVHVRAEFKCSENETWIRVQPPFADIADSQPELLVKTNAEETTDLLIRINPLTTQLDVDILWTIIESYQRKMSGFKAKVKELPNLERNLEIFTIHKIGKNSLAKALDQWWHQHPDESTAIDYDSLKRSIKTLNEEFKPINDI